MADCNEAELELLAGFLQKVTAAGVIAATLSDGGCCRIGDSIRRSDSMPAHLCQLAVEKLERSHCGSLRLIALRCWSLPGLTLRVTYR